jgi:predicted nucleic acid-binding protein
MSPQVLNESYWVVARKPAFAHARAMIRSYLGDHRAWTTAPLEAQTLFDAWALEDRYGIGFWDALLLASANSAGCAVFLSEDLNDGQTYGRVKAVNPFRHAPADVLGPALR